MMFCRAAWQRLAPLARKSPTPLFSNAVFPIRQMSFGLPASGTNMAYMVIGGSSLTAALVYAYKTINSDSERYNERIAQLEARPKIGAAAALASVAEAAAIVESAVAENTAIVEATAAELAVEVVDAKTEEVPEHVDGAMVVDAAMEVEAETAIVQAVAADAEEPTAPVVEDVEDVAAETAAPIAETTVVTMSDLPSTVKILAGSTGEIAAASVGDQHPVATLRLAEDNNSVEILNGLEAVEVSAEVPEEAEVEEPMIGRSDLKIEEGELEELPSALRAEETTEVGDDHIKSEEAKVEEPMIGRSDQKIEEGELEELPSGLQAEEETTEVGDDHIKSEEPEFEEPMIGRSDLKMEEGELQELLSALQAVEDDHIKSEEDSPVVAEVNAESPASSEEASVTKMESILEGEESLSPEVMLSDNETMSGSAEVTSEMVMALGQQIEEDKALCHEPAATETEHSDLTAPPTDLEEALEATTESAEEVAVEMMLDSVEEAKPVKASEEAVESGNVLMTMAQA
ncbi:probable serine/threonine-protein kinase kinX isoform X2 [Pimephales promelas]|uniref:probable serine/threonine-protein kinase kinX isoform X2 n=1 Tax=Pimephales promelas TaxID=90988 RepID=UPI0019558197|nr:probable serine/threonine-protein kinase kinX isoform X2 [Pimephales promelas]